MEAESDSVSLYVHCSAGISSTPAVFASTPSSVYEHKNCYSVCFSFLNWPLVG